MNDRIEFDNVLTQIDKYETNIENYLIQNSNCKFGDGESPFVAYHEPPFQIQSPKVSIWEFMDRDNLKEFINLNKNSHIRKSIDLHIGKNRPKGKGRTVFVELMYNVTKFCKVSDFSLEKTGALLSQFYLTHLFFTSKLDMSAGKVYTYFKDLSLCHSLPFPPNNLKIFSHIEMKEIMELFCKLYLRNLPLLRFLSLPNFALYVSYELEPESMTTKKSVTKEKEEPKEISKKRSKQGNKKGSKK